MALIIMIGTQRVMDEKLLLITTKCMCSWRFKVKFKPMNEGNDNKTNTDRKAVIQAMTHTQCCMSGWRIIGALNLPRASSRQLAYNTVIYAVLIAEMECYTPF